MAETIQNRNRSDARIPMAANQNIQPTLSNGLDPPYILFVVVFVMNK